MPNINDLQFGYDSSGVNAYLEEVKASSLQKAADDADDISEIRKALEATWEGEAREQYLTNLESDIQKFQDALTTLYSTFETEVGNASMNMYEFDKNLIK